MSGHRPSVSVTGRPMSWVTCECGWKSPIVRGRAWAASLHWAQHILDRARRKQGTP